MDLPLTFEADSPTYLTAMAPDNPGYLQVREEGLAISVGSSEAIITDRRTITLIRFALDKWEATQRCPVWTHGLPGCNLSKGHDGPHQADCTDDTGPVVLSWSTEAKKG